MWSLPATHADPSELPVDTVYTEAWTWFEMTVGSAAAWASNFPCNAWAWSATFFCSPSRIVMRSLVLLRAAVSACSFFSRSFTLRKDNSDSRIVTISNAIVIAMIVWVRSRGGLAEGGMFLATSRARALVPGRGIAVTGVLAGGRVGAVSVGGAVAAGSTGAAAVGSGIGWSI